MVNIECLKRFFFFCDIVAILQATLPWHLDDITKGKNHRNQEFSERNLRPTTRVPPSIGAELIPSARG